MLLFFPPFLKSVFRAGHEKQIRIILTNLTNFCEASCFFQIDGGEVSSMLFTAVHAALLFRPFFIKHTLKVRYYDFAS